MLAREVVPLPEHVYPPDEGRIVESRFDPRHLARAETIFAQSNGFIGFRGTFDEGRPGLSPATFVNGFHETWDIEHAEEAYGLARTGQSIINVPDATVLKLYVDDEPLYLPTARLREYERVLDLENGVVTRDLFWSTPAGKHVRLRSRRLVSFEHRHVAAFQLEVTVLNHFAPLTVVSKILNRQDSDPEDEPQRRILDPRLARTFSHRVLEPEVCEDPNGRLLLAYRAANSGMHLAMGVDHQVESAADVHTSLHPDPDRSRMEVRADAEPGVPIRITKFVTYQTSTRVPGRELVERCHRTLDRTARDGMPALLEAQRERLASFWKRADVQVQCKEETETSRTQQAIRWNIFQLGQASLRAEGVGVPAKGLTGHAYEGHYFWDTEVYVLPFLAYTFPRIARNLLRHRHQMLDRARERARELSQEGALFPWRTINGEEASAYYQAGTAQYHIDADISYAIRKYVDIRGHTEFLSEVGGEILVETARMWADLGFYGDDGHFHIHSVTGPDEYTTVVNDNTFTNLMARLNLNYAADAMGWMEKHRPLDYQALISSVHLREGEVQGWKDAARHMFVPYDERRGIHPQDSEFLERKRWDLESTPRENFPLLLHYHPLVIYRHQVIKQADVVLAMYLLGNEFTEEQKRRNFDYYDPITTGDSSLSAGIQSIVANEVGRDDKALEYFHYALMMDLGNVQGNVSDGVHVASTGAAWQALIFGFGGVRDFDGDLTIDPRLPYDWDQLTFPLRFQDRQLQVTLTHEVERFELLSGEPLQLAIRGTPHVLEEGEPLELPPGG